MGFLEMHLKLFLDALGVSSDGAGLGDRKRVQKAVYIGQSADADLGYVFGWYLLGPYSPELTDCYRSLIASIGEGDDRYKCYKLKDYMLERLSVVKSVMKVPSGVCLSQEDWLELFASVIYIMKETEGMADADTIMDRLSKNNSTCIYEYVGIAMYYYEGIKDELTERNPIRLI